MNEKTCTKTGTETKMNLGTQCIVPCNLSKSNFRSKQLLLLHAINGMYNVLYYGKG